METHIWNNPVQPSSFCVWACARVWEMGCVAVPQGASVISAWSFCSVVTTCGLRLCPRWLPLSAYASHSQHPFVPFIQSAYTGLISPLLPFCALTRSLWPLPEVPLCLLISHQCSLCSLETPCCCGTVLYPGPVSLKVCSSEQQSHKMILKNRKRGSML